MYGQLLTMYGQLQTMLLIVPGLNGRGGCIDRFCDIVVGISKHERNLKWLSNSEWSL